MMFTLPDLRNYLILGLAASTLVLGLSTCSYRRMYVSTDYALGVQNQAIKAQKDTAEKRIAELSRERDDLYEKQTKKDEDVQIQIAEYERRLLDRPISVRVAPGPRCSSGGSPGKGSGGGTQDSAPATGILPDANARRLKQVIAEMEQVNAAYTSCRETLVR